MNICKNYDELSIYGKYGFESNDVIKKIYHHTERIGRQLYQPNSNDSQITQRSETDNFNSEIFP